MTQSGEGLCVTYERHNKKLREEADGWPDGAHQDRLDDIEIDSAAHADVAAHDNDADEADENLIQHERLSYDGNQVRYVQRH